MSRKEGELKRAQPNGLAQDSDQILLCSQTYKCKQPGRRTEMASPHQSFSKM